MFTGSSLELQLGEGQHKQNYGVHRVVILALYLYLRAY